MLKYECPSLYEVIIRISPNSETRAPTAQLIELVGQLSDDSSVRKPKFRRYLKEYRKYGLYCHRAQVMTPARAAYYERIRKRKRGKYIEENPSKVVQAMKK